MMKQREAIFLLAVVFFGSTGIASAHHSYAMFDRTKSNEVSGTVRTFQWVNPHSYLWVNATNAKGGQDVWGFEFGGGPAGLARAGWRKNTLKPGDKVTIKYNPLKDGRTGGEFEQVTLSDGTVMDSRGVVPPGGRKDECHSANGFCASKEEGGG